MHEWINESYRNYIVKDIVYGYVYLEDKNDTKITKMIKEEDFEKSFEKYLEEQRELEQAKNGNSIIETFFKEKGILSRKESKGDSLYYSILDGGFDLRQIINTDDIPIASMIYQLHKRSIHTYVNPHKFTDGCDYTNLTISVENDFRGYHTFEKNPDGTYKIEYAGPKPADYVEKSDFNDFLLSIDEIFEVFWKNVELFLTDDIIKSGDIFYSPGQGFVYKNIQYTDYHQETKEFEVSRCLIYGNNRYRLNQYEKLSMPKGGKKVSKDDIKKWLRTYYNKMVDVHQLRTPYDVLEKQQLD